MPIHLAMNSALSLRSTCLPMLFNVCDMHKMSDEAVNVCRRFL